MQNSTIKKKTIAIVDDNLSFAESMAEKLSAYSNLFECVIHDDPLTIDKMIVEKSPEIILIDYQMPSMSGIDCLKIIRKKISRLDLPIIFHTSDESSQTIVDAFSSGANDYLIKGAPLSVVVSRIQTQLNILELSADRMKLIELQAVMALIVSYNHEIRNPLTIAIGNASLCLKSNEDERIQRVEKIQNALHRIEEIVDKLKKIGEKVELEYELYAGNRKMLKL